MQKKEKTPEELEDFKNRAEQFQPKFLALLQEYKIGLMCQLRFTEDGRIEALPVFFDDSENPIFVQKEKDQAEKKIISAE